MRRTAKRILDEYLVASAKAGDQIAFEKLAIQWQTKLIAHAYRLTNDVDMAQEVAQDSWLDISRNIQSLKDTAVFPAWAYRIVTRRAIDRIRRVQRKRRTEAAYAAEPKQMVTNPLTLHIAIEKTPLGKAIANLPTAQRVTIALFYLEELSVAEISTALSVPTGTVKTRLMNARKKLRAALTGDENE